MASPPLAGVIGWPIAHSLSPRLYAHWLRRHSISGYYIPVGLPPDDLIDGLAALRTIGLRGVNVTLPHKERAFSLATTVSDRAARIGAANTLTFLENGGFHADNTDGYGFLENLRHAAPGWLASRGPALVLGAGGAARGVVASLVTEGAPDVRIANRSRDRAETLAADFGPKTSVVDWNYASNAVADAALIVNTTSLGMTGQPELPLRLDSASRGTVVCDIVYRPLETAFLHHARALGLTAVDGLGMLLHQAVPGFNAWFGTRPDVDDALRQAILAP